MGVHTMITEHGVSTGNAPVSLVVKLPGWLREQARAAAKRRGETVSDVVQTALAEYLMADGEETAAAQDARVWEHDGLFNLVGLGTGGPADLSSDKYAHFTEALD
jgi:hypothetical protein